MNRRQLEAQLLWRWLQPRLPPEVRAQAEQYLLPEAPPPVVDPTLVAGLAELLDNRTTDARRLQLVKGLLTIIKNG